MVLKWLKNLFGGTAEDISETAVKIERNEMQREVEYKKIKNLDKVLAASAGKKIVIFKHSNACGTSRSAKSEVDSFSVSHPEVEVYLVVVQEQRPVSDEIAQKLGVPHESPQLFIVEDGRAVAHWSHWDIKKSEIEAVF